MPSQIVWEVSVVLGLSLIVIICSFTSGWHNVPATVFCNEVVNFIVYIPALVKVISGSKEEAVPVLKLQPELVAFGQFWGLVWVTCQAYTLVLAQPGKLDKLSKVIVVGAQPDVGLSVKSAITSGLTHMVFVWDDIPQLFDPEVNKVILYVPGVLKVIFNAFDAVLVQIDGLLGKFALKPKFPRTEINEFAGRIPVAGTVKIPDGPVICQYLL